MGVDIGPGTLVECVNGKSQHGRRAFVLEVNPAQGCVGEHGPCTGLVLQGWPCPHPKGWAMCAFKPVGGDREIEVELARTRELEKT